MKKNPWEKWEVDFLREVAATMPVEVIAEKLERTEKAVMAKYHFSVISPQKK